MKEDKSKKYRVFIFTTAIVLMVLGFAVLMVVGRLEGRGIKINTGIVMVVFFACEAIALLMLFCNIKYFIADDLSRMDNKYDGIPFNIFQDVSRENVHRYFQNQKFKPAQEGYLRKRTFTFSKDFICYYMKTIDVENLAAGIEDELNNFDHISEKTKCVCCILFAYKNDLTEEDFDELRDLSKLFIIDETIVPVQNYTTILIVLVDAKTNQAYYLDIQKKWSISVYAHGCRMLNKVMNFQK